MFKNSVPQRKSGGDLSPSEDLFKWFKKPGGGSRQSWAPVISDAQTLHRCIQTYQSIADRSIWTSRQSCDHKCHLKRDSEAAPKSLDSGASGMDLHTETKDKKTHPEKQIQKSRPVMVRVPLALLVAEILDDSCCLQNYIFSRDLRGCKTTFCTAEEDLLSWRVSSGGYVNVEIQTATLMILYCSFKCCENDWQHYKVVN